MKKMICLLLVGLLAGLEGCGHTSYTDPSTTATTILNEPLFGDRVDEAGPVTVGYVIYAGSSSGELMGPTDVSEEISNIRFGSLSERDFSYTKKRRSLMRMQNRKEGSR